VGNERRVVRPRDSLRKNSERGMQRRAARARAEGAIAVGAGGRAAGAAIAARLCGMKRAGNARLIGSEVRVASRAVGSLLRNDRMSGIWQRVAAQRRSRYLREARKQAETKARGPRPVSRFASMEGGCSHVLPQGTLNATTLQTLLAFSANSQAEICLWQAQPITANNYRRP
jgi:hypothetical protein